MNVGSSCATTYSTGTASLGAASIAEAPEYVVGPERLMTAATGGLIRAAAATEAVPPIEAPISTTLVAPSLRRNAAAATTAPSIVSVESVEAPVPGKSNASTR